MLKSTGDANGRVGRLRVMSIREENGQIIVDELRHMSDEDLLIEALDLIYEIRGAYINTKDMSYERHAKDLHELERITTLIEKRLRG